MLDDAENKMDIDAIRWAETLVALESVEKGDLIPGDLVERWLKTWGTPNECDKEILSYL